MVAKLRSLVRGRYRIIDEISSTPESRVLLAEDLRQGGQRCALKLLRLRGETAFEAARREFDSLRKLRHPGIAEVYDFGRLDALPGEPGAARRAEGAAAEDWAVEPLAYLASVYFDGLSLREAFLRLFGDGPPGGSPTDSRDGETRWSVFLEALAQVSEALDAIHARGLIHYDIKPENLLLIPSPAEGVPSRFDVKILDFGFSEEETTPLGSRVRGTIPYIAPEIIQSSLADRRSDLFSLGVTVAFSITGRFPFPGSGPERWLAAARSGRRIDLRKLRPDAPEGIPELIHRLLEPDPARRPATALLVLEEIERIGRFRLPEKRRQIERSFPQVGWERELALVRGSIDDLRRGEAGKPLLLVEGDAGQFLGRFVDDVEAMARFEGVTVARGFSQLPRRYPYQPFAEIIRELALEIDFSAPRFARFRWLLARFAAGNGHHPQETGDAADGGGPPALKLRSEVHRFIDLATEFFIEAARDRPLVLCIQDLHIAGRESLDLLRSLARNVHRRTGSGEDGDPEDAGEPARILIIGAVRDVEGEREADADLAASFSAIHEIASEPFAARVRLASLGLENLPAWIRERAPRLQLDGDLIRRLHERSGGSMWLVDEFVRRITSASHAEERTATDAEPGRPSATGEPSGGVAMGPEILFSLPRKAEESALDRLESLTTRDRRLLEVLSAARGRLRIEEVEEVEAALDGNVESTTPRRDDAREHCLERLEVLEDLGFADLRYGAGGITVQVCQPGLAAEVYRQIGEDARLAVHRALAVGLERSAGREGQSRVPEDVAFHAWQGGAWGLYFREALAAARRLSAAQAHEGAAQVLEAILERLGAASPVSREPLEDDAEEEGLEATHASTKIDAEALRTHVHEKLAEIYLGKGQLQKALEKLTLLSTAREMLPASADLARVYRLMGEVYQQNGELANAGYFLEKSLKILQDAGEPEKRVGDQPQMGRGPEDPWLRRPGALDGTGERLQTLLALARYHLAREEPHDAEKNLRECREGAGSAPAHREALARALTILAEIEVRRGRHAAGVSLNLEALETAKAGGNLPLILEILGALGTSRIAHGDYDKAIECFEQGLEVARTLESKFDVAWCCSSLGTVYHNRADHQRALEQFTRSLHLSHQIGDLRGIATGYNNLGIVYRLKDELARAADAYKRAIDLFSRINDQLGMAAGMNNLSSILELEGKYNEALDYSFRALEKRKKSRSRSGIAFSYYRIGKIFQSKGELDKAVTYAEKSLQIRKELGEKLGTAYSRLLLSELYLVQGKYHEAFHLCQGGLKDFESLENEVGVLMARETFARVLLQFGDVGGAKKMLEEVLERCRNRDERKLLGNCLLGLGRASLELGDPAQAEERISEAERLFRTNQNRRDLAEAFLERCALKLAAGQSADASRPLEEAYSILEDLGARDLVPLYFLLRSRVEMEKPHVDMETARKFLERGLVEAREVNLPDLRWRFHHRIGLLEARRGDSRLARIHFQEARDILEEACRGVPPRHRKTFYRLREREEIGKAASIGLETARQESPEAGGEAKTFAPEERGFSFSSEEVLSFYQETLKLHEIAAAMGHERDIQKLLECIMDAVLDLVDAERGFIILKSAGSAHRTVTVARNLERQIVQEPERKISESISRQVLRTGKPVIARNAIGDSRFLGSKSIRNLRLRSLICVPLRFRNEVLGAIYLDNRHRRDAFRPQDLNILQTFADQAAVAVTNARLIDENRKRTADLVEANRRKETLNLKLRRKVHKRTAELALVREDLLERQHQLEARYRFRNIVGKSEAMERIFLLLEKVAPTQLPILLEGESGTGKELIARAIHFNSLQREGRFLIENCGSLSESLLETELFGHTRGAFTGAVSEKKGLFELADGGTLFLDEVGDMSLGMQQKLLRVLEDGGIRRVGGKETIPIRVRILSASNRDLAGLVAEGKFRGDLYFRLNGIRIHVPSLRSRKEDIPSLVEHFVEEAARTSGGPVRRLDAELLRLLVAHNWPGNVRELRHFIERTLLTSPGEVIRKEDILFDIPWLPGPGGLREGVPGNGTLPPGPVLAGRPFSEVGSLRAARAVAERQFLVEAVREAEGNASAAARRCGISRESFYRLLRKHRINAR
jgi:transcriptional regulator with GAF, ATPase, and Fis domain/serine/threonine protein kinase